MEQLRQITFRIHSVYTEAQEGEGLAENSGKLETKPNIAFFIAFIT